EDAAVFGDHETDGDARITAITAVGNVRALARNAVEQAFFLRNLPCLLDGCAADAQSFDQFPLPRHTIMRLEDARHDAMTKLVKKLYVERQRTRLRNLEIEHVRNLSVQVRAYHCFY